MTSSVYEAGKSYEKTSPDLLGKVKRGLFIAARTGLEFADNAHLRFEARISRVLGSRAGIQTAADDGELHPALRDLLQEQGHISSILDEERFSR
ncbi:MAG TPA: hypothetical protein PK096_03170 [Candidatus Saccharibacteria bacterium]|nr:hypothetical protein [Candidatus Saccharibacteria bacterium]HRK94343.1 hypothetical protein [Candidatus Saccharibacteria bacterium]